MNSEAMLKTAGHSRRKGLLRTPLNARFGVFFILFYSIAMEALIENLHLPGTIRYLNDVVLIAVIFGIQGRFLPILRKEHSYMLWGAVCALFVMDIFTAVINLVSPLLVMWAVRNTFRGLIYLFCVIAVLHVEDMTKLFHVLLGLQLPNLLLAIYQSLVTSGGNPDFVHGLFANGAGANTFSAVLFAYYLNAYLNGREPVWTVAFVAVTSIMIAAMAEEKTFFLYFIVIFVLSILISRWSLKTLCFIAVAFIAGIFLVQYIAIVMPDILEFLTDWNTSKTYLTATWADSYGIPRLGAFTFIAKNFFNNDFATSLFGFGFGSAEHSQFAFLDSPFYLRYGELSYRSFTHQWTFIETGYIGFGLFVLVFIIALICLCKQRWIYRKYDAVLNLTGICMCVVCIISMWSNATLKLDVSYIPCFGVAIGFLTRKGFGDVPNEKSETV